jgi:phospholipase/lecithinase/hemolysin
MAQGLNIPFTYAGDPSSAGKGLNFAVSGARTGSSEGVRIRPANAACGSNEALLGRGIETQIQEFSQRARSGRLRFDPEKTLFFIAGGLNDAGLPASTSRSNLERGIRMLHEVGARYVLIALLPTRLSLNAPSYKALNRLIRRLPSDLQSQMPGIRIGISRWGEYYDEVLEKHQRYGIINTTDRCAGRALWGEDTTPCLEPARYFYFHEGHPSTAVHRIVGLELQQEVMRTFP